MIASKLYSFTIPLEMEPKLHTESSLLFFYLNFFLLQNSLPLLRVVLTHAQVIPVFGNLVYLIPVHERVSFYQIHPHTRSRKKSV